MRHQINLNKFSFHQKLPQDKFNKQVASSLEAKIALNIL